MKRIFLYCILIGVLALAGLPLRAGQSGSRDGEDHSLTALWKVYYSAVNDDKPQDQLKALANIKSKAKASKFLWDWYDACDRYAQVRTSINWKDREDAFAEFNKEVESFGEPLLRFFHSRDSYYGGRKLDNPLQFVQKNASPLRKGRHTEFYTRDYRLKLPDNRLGPLLLKNDYEFCLWCIADDDRLVSEFKEYPLSAFAAFRAALYSGNNNPANLNNVAERYKGKAAGLYAEAEILVREFYDLSAKKGVISENFVALRDKILDFQRRRDAFKGEEKAIAELCTGADGILEELNRKEIRAVIEDGALTVSLRNLANVSIRICDGKKTVFEKYLTNPVGSYYLEDKLRIDLPAIDDGSYKVKCSSGDTSDEIDYNKYTISLAARSNASGIGIWATDYLSGEPLREVELELLKDDVKVDGASLKLNGYTTVPDRMRKLIEADPYKYRFRVRSEAGGIHRESKSVPARKNPVYAKGKDVLRAIILTDRSVYTPDETLHFKVIAYRDEYDPRALAEGESLRVVLKDPEGNELACKDLKTNGFGSVAGEFTVTRARRNGNYRLEVYKDGKHVIAKNIRVDDFVLPTFDLCFDGRDELIQPVSEINCSGTVNAYSGHSLQNASITYKVEHYGQVWKEGSLHPGSNGRFSIVFPTDSTRRNSYDYYSVSIRVTDPTGESAEFQKTFRLRTKSGIRIQTEHFFTDSSEGNDAALDVVAGKKPCWMMVEVYGTNGKLLRSGVEHFEPSGDKPAKTTVRYSLEAGALEGVKICVLYFQDGDYHSKTIRHYRQNMRCALPLGFSRFLDTTAPGASYTFGIKTAPGVECAATIFDKSTERFVANRWNAVTAKDTPLPEIPVLYEAGCNNASRSYRTRGSGPLIMAKSSSANALSDSASGIEEESIAFYSLGDETSYQNTDIPIRESFANTIAWEPFLRSDKDGNISFSFTNADKLSTYYVQLFAHDALMHNAALRQEMQVTIPVKISLLEPRFLYDGDIYSVRIALSSSRSKPTVGTLKVIFLDGSDYRTAPVVQEYSCPVTVPAMDGAVADIPVSTSGLKVLGIKAVFVPEAGTFGSDGIFVSVPVRKAEQTLSEGHSAVLLSGADKEALEADLRAMFINVAGSDAQMREISIRNMLEEAIPSELDVRSDNAMDLSKALLAYELCRRLGQEPSFDRDDAVRKLLACRCDGGGFAWFAGMPASCIVTAVILERLRGLGIIDEAAAVQWIDGNYFRHEESRWKYSGLSLEQYLYLRSLYPAVPFAQKTDAAFRKAARGYLVPSKARGLNSRIYAKARRVLTLENLLASEDGTALARKMGIKLGTVRKMRRSLDADVTSLVQYAQTHRSGGVYFPNAVMPWRGLLESELYAHTMLCRLMDRRDHGDIADGIRLWMMLQKETQHWESDPAYIDAIACVQEGSESILQTRVLALRAEYTKPFAEILPAGNGISISSVADNSAWPGDSLKVGDRITLKWEVSSEENRSFVRISLPFNAGLSPVNQLSGYKWGCYRNVLADSIELWYEVLPEGNITLTEDFFVSRAGTFQCPASEVICNYAPHYSANTACPAPQSIEQ